MEELDKLLLVQVLCCWRCSCPGCLLQAERQVDATCMAHNSRRALVLNMRAGRRLHVSVSSALASLKLQLRDGRKIIGTLRSFDQFANLVLSGAFDPMSCVACSFTCCAITTTFYAQAHSCPCMLQALRSASSWESSTLRFRWACMLSGERWAHCTSAIETAPAVTGCLHTVISRQSPSSSRAESLSVCALCSGENVVLLGELDAAREPPPGLQLVSESSQAANSVP